MQVINDLSDNFRYLASGDYRISQAFAFRMGRSTVCTIIKETCEAIWNVLAKEYLKFPSREEFVNLAMEFEERWNFPHCVGSIDGKHIQMVCPPNTGSLYYNYKGNFSKVLLAVSDAKYRFIYVDIGGFGGRSDGGIFSHSSLGRSLETGKLDWPQSSPISGMPSNLPYFMVGDEAFPLKTSLLRPYPSRQLTTKRRIFNYRLSRARRVIESTFGILSARWRILCRCIQASPETVDSIIKACVCLHNFVMTKESKVNSDMKYYCPLHFIDKEAADGTIIEGQWRKEIGSGPSLPQRPCQQHNYSLCARDIREQFATYFQENNILPWQLNYVNRIE
ncbi:uncharacterized protein [Centruroides vittatus]|uniref:uncharacterized protein n=1 Tax=Centruroides vittatus TaxID=120091 RepID=UPI00350F8652